MKKVITILLALALMLSVPGRLVLPVSASTLPFTDVPASHPYYSSIEFVYEKGYMSGTSVSTFSPNNYISRAMLVTILYSMSGSTLKRAPTGFTDVSSSSYYYYAIGWAQYYGIVSGTSDTTFSPQDNVIKQDFLLILYGYLTKYKGYSYSLVDSNLVQGLSDYSSISSYARTAVNWTMNCDVVSSLSTSLAPKSNVARGLCAKYIHYAATLCTGDSLATARTSLSKSTTEAICQLLSDNGYESYYIYNLTPIAMEFAFRNSSIVYSHSHGNDKFIALLEGYLYDSDIDAASLINAELIYISACNAGGTFCRTLSEKGAAETVIGFTGVVAASTDDNGIHFFNERFFYYYLNGYSIDDAIDKARSEAEADYNGTFGAENIVVYN